jgi:bacteriocin biosynthesis cyclodehydratase domain-containing protein
LTGAPFVLFAEGPFGAAVAAQLAPRVGCLRVLPLAAGGGRLADSVAGAEFVAAALWRRYPAELDALDAACHEHGLRWSGAVLEDTHLRCGPLVHPFAGPCHACYRTRWWTHVAGADREEALDAHFAADAAAGVPGFTPSAVALAVASLLLDRDAPAGAAGRVRLLDLLSCRVEEARVVRVHGCARCSRRGPSPGRYVDDLVAALDPGRAP